MKKRFFALALAMLMAATAVTGCSNGSSSGGAEQTIVHNIGGEPQTIDPSLNTTVEGNQIIRSAFEGLCVVDQNDQIAPGIAESWDISEDGTVYTFHLRDAKWSDGQPVTANDFVYSWQRAVEPSTGAGFVAQMYYVKNGLPISQGEMPKEELGVKAIDDKTLEVTLEQPTSYFLELTTITCYIPLRQDIVEADPEGWTLNPETYVSNGPFKMTEWSHNDVLVMEKNENYYDADKVQLNRLEYVMIQEASTAYSAFEAGEIDYTASIPADQVVRLKESGENPNFKIEPSYGVYFYSINMEDEVMSNPNLRKALSYAIDRQAIVDNVTKGGQLPADKGYIPTGVPTPDGSDFAEKYGVTTYGATADVEKAKQCLADAGYPNGEGLPAIELIYNTSENHKAIAEAIQEMWKQNLGIEVTLRNEEWAVYLSTLQEGNYQVGRSGLVGNYLDPMTLLDVQLSTAENNRARYNSEAYDKALNESRVLSGEARYEKLAEAQQILMEDLPIIPIYYYTSPILMRTTIKDASKSALDFVNYKYAHVEEEGAEGTEESTDSENTEETAE